MVSQSNLKGTIEGVHFQPPDTLLDAEAVRQHIYAEPFYWRLPKQFQGDQVSRHQLAPSCSRKNLRLDLLPVTKGLGYPVALLSEGGDVLWL